MSLHPSSIQTITVGLGVPPSHASPCWRLGVTKDLLVGYTTDRELHPAPKVFIRLLRLYPAGHKLHNSLAPSARAGVCPRAFYISIRCDNAIDWTHAPQAMQSSVIFMVMVATPSKICYCGYKINPCHEWRQMSEFCHSSTFLSDFAPKKQAAFTRSSKQGQKRTTWEQRHRQRFSSASNSDF